eukprot:scpid106569/ scgid9912/ 
MVCELPVQYHDIAHCMEKASQIFGRMFCLWHGKEKVSEGRRLRIYIAPRDLHPPLYNCETWGLPESNLASLDVHVFHRKQLHTILGIRHPHHNERYLVQEVQL